MLVLATTLRCFSCTKDVVVTEASDLCNVNKLWKLDQMIMNTLLEKHIPASLAICNENKKVRRINIDSNSL